ncbi:Dynein axonemal heavy chain 11, partial [Lemmus lemmus]
MPFTSGNIRWARMLLERLQIFWSNFTSFHYLFPDSPDKAAVCQKYAEMTALLDRFESHVYGKWKRNVEEICELNLNQ